MSSCSIHRLKKGPAMSIEDTTSKLVDTAIKAISFFSWSRIGILVALLVVAGLTTMFIETRPRIEAGLNMMLGPAIRRTEIPHPISETTKTNIRSVVDRSKSIVAAQLVNLDFVKNEKHPVFFYADISVLETDMNSYLSTALSYSPIFINGDEENNSRLIQIINGDFVCVVSPLRVVKLVPIVAKTTKALCSISVPPYYGSIVGYANLWLDHFPDVSEYPDLRAIARTMSVDVYERDVRGQKM